MNEKKKEEKEGHIQNLQFQEEEAKKKKKIYVKNLKDKEINIGKKRLGIK